MSIKDELAEFIQTGQIRDQARRASVLIERSYVFIDMRPSRAVGKEQPLTDGQPSGNIIPLRPRRR